MKNNRKKSVLFIITIGFLYLFTTNILLAQSYKPLAVDGVHWIIVFNEDETILPVDQLYEYYCEGDTLLNNVLYKKIFKRDMEVTQSGPPFTPISEYQIAGFIREDTITKKVYAIDWVTDFFDLCPNGEEHLLYDFSLNTGDTVNFCLYPWNDHVIIDIFYSNSYNQTVKTFRTNMAFYFEGIGSEFGLFEEMSFNEHASTSLEYYCPGTPCEYIVSSKNLIVPDFFTISPNPATNLVHISFDKKNQWDKLVVYNNLGTIIKDYTLPVQTDNFTINCENLTPGFYFCGLVTGSTRSPLNKLIIVR